MLFLVAILIVLVRFIYALVIGDHLNAYIFGPTTIFVLIFFITFYRHYRRLIQHALTVTNIGLMLYQLLLINFGFQEAYIFGQNMMTLHLVIILITDFPFSIIQLLGSLVLRFTIGFVKEDLSA